MISIIIPTYNRATILEATLQSIIAQSSPHWECLVVDDGSTDNTEHVMSVWTHKDTRFKFFKRPDNRLKGPSACRNIGLENASGNFVMFLDSDDCLISECIAGRIDIAEKDDQKDFWIFPMSSFTEERLLKDFSEYEAYSSKQFLDDFIAMEFPWNVTAPLYKIEFLKQLGGFSEEMQVFEDPELAVRTIVRSEGNFSYINRSDSFYKLSDPSEAKPVALSHLLNYYEKIIDYLEKHEAGVDASVFKKTLLKFIRSTQITPQNSEQVWQIHQLFGKKITLTKKEQKGIALLKLLNSKFYKNIGYYWLKKQINERYLS